MAGDILNAIVEHEMEAGIIQERLDYPSLQDHPLVVESYRGITVMSILAKLRTRMYVTLDSSLKLDCLLATCTGSTLNVQRSCLQCRKSLQDMPMKPVYMCLYEPMIVNSCYVRLYL